MEGSFPFGESVKFGWEKVKENFWNLIAVAVITLVVSWVFNSFQKNIEKTLPLVALIIGICSSLVNMLITLGIIKIGLKVYAGEKFEISEMFTNYQPFLNYFLASILYAVAVILGLILLIIPGIIIAIRMGYYGYLIVDKEMGPVDALKESFKMTKGNCWNLFLFGLLMFCVGLLGVLALLVGLVVAIPVIWIAYVFVYRYLEEKQLAPAV